LRNLHGGLAEKISGGGNGDVADDFYHRYKAGRMLVIGFQRGKNIFLISFNNRKNSTGGHKTDENNWIGLLQIFYLMVQNITE